MYRQQIPTVEYLRSISDLPEDLSDLQLDTSVPSMQQSVVNYYENYSPFPFISFKLLDESDTTIDSVNSLLGQMSTKPLQINSITLTSETFSNYSKEQLKYLQFDVSDFWNSELAFIIFNGGDVIVGKTDYYTHSSISKLLQYESLYASSVDEPSTNYPIRDKLLHSYSDFSRPLRPTPGGSGAVIILKTPHGWRMILGRRSKEVSINQEMISIFPNGGIEYDDLQANGFSEGAKREFGEELFTNVDKGKQFINDYCSVKQVTSGWNIRDGGLLFGYLFISDNEQAYNTFINQLNQNSELDELIEVDIFDITEVLEMVNMNEMSGGAIATVYSALHQFNQESSYPNLPYQIKPIVN